MAGPSLKSFGFATDSPRHLDRLAQGEHAKRLHVEIGAGCERDRADHEISRVIVNLSKDEQNPQRTRNQQQPRENNQRLRQPFTLCRSARAHYCVACTRSFTRPKNSLNPVFIAFRYSSLFGTHGVAFGMAGAHSSRKRCCSSRRPSARAPLFGLIPACCAQCPVSEKRACWFA